MSSHADTIRDALSCITDQEDAVREGSAALDALLAENQRLRDALRGIEAQTPTTPQEIQTQFWARGALAGDTE